VVDVRIEIASDRHRPTFLEAVKRSRKLHGRWVSPPDAEQAYDTWISRMEEERYCAFIIIDPAQFVPAGVVALSEIIRGPLQSAFVSYYALEPYAGRGYTSAGLLQVIAHAFKELRLHRLEANIQPANIASKRIAARTGFKYEGFTPRYLKINGRWRDHERWAVLRENFRARA
jgi:[ribosomal protein S5]-alanine N-acetyltransferase